MLNISNTSVLDSQGQICCRYSNNIETEMYIVVNL